MLIFLFLCFINAVSPDCSGGEQFMSLSLSDPLSYNLTVSQVSARSIEVSWNCKGHITPDKYEVTLKPQKESYKIVETVAHNDCYLKMKNRLEPDTVYHVSVTSIAGRTRRRSNNLYFRTPCETKEESNTEISEEGEDPDGSFESGESKSSLRLPRVRLVEISLVGMALVLWAGAIVLFFHRWGKIRMLLPYQPAYKEMTQTNSACTNCSLTPHHQSDIPEVPARICRKAKSAEQLRYDPRYDDFDYFDYQDF